MRTSPRSSTGVLFFLPGRDPVQGAHVSGGKGGRSRGVFGLTGGELLLLPYYKYSTVVVVVMFFFFLNNHVCHVIFCAVVFKSTHDYLLYRVLLILSKYSSYSYESYCCTLQTLQQQ